MTHKLLDRQLRKHFAQGAPDSEEFAAFCAAVDAAYAANDADRVLLERSIELASTELLEQNAQLERDLASIKRLELELRQAEKLRAVGQLAAGVAHEINTPIQYVGDSLHFIKESCRSLLRLSQQATEGISHSVMKETAEEIGLSFLADEVPSALEQIEAGVKRVGAIVSALKDFGHPEASQVAVTDVNRCLETALLIAQNELRQVASVEVVLGDLPPLRGYPGDLSQVLLSLLVNAAHAVTERFGNQDRRAWIHVTTRLVGGEIVICVADNGSGIRADHQPRIFEPFFTTKPFGKGSGQALAVAHGIVVHKHGGSISFESRAGSGSTFRVQLPTAGRQPSVDPVPGPQSKAA
ncbi:MAG TPA: ATP-binding protein [Polyangiaceae bacterium]|nr:ATP-binding protein [Polyangiaceae bacterium]